MNNRQKGFSLIELLVVIALAGILAAIAFPSFTGLYRTARIREGTRDIASELRRVRQAAITGNKEYRLCVDLDNESYMRERGLTSNSSTSEACGATGGDWTPETGWSALPQGVNICYSSSGAVSTGTDRYKFNPNGSGSSGSIWLTDGTGNRFQIIITSTTGRVRIERPTTGIPAGC